MNKLYNKGLELVNNYRGWKTTEKIVVFESDDWGSIRTSSKEALIKLAGIGLKVDYCHYMLFDSLESKSDLESLFEVLSRHKDCHGQHPLFTINAIVANPDFQKIKEVEFDQYFYEPFTKTYERQGKSDLINLWSEGMNAKVAMPQFHGREHVNIKRWLVDLKLGRPDTLLAFDNAMYGISGHVAQKKRGSYLSVFDEQGEDKEFVNSYMSEGIALFRKSFGFYPKTFIAPNYIWNSLVEKAAATQKIKYMQGRSTQILPTQFDKRQGLKKNYVGKRSKQTNIGYLVRNANFEPASDFNRDWVTDVMKEIETAFRMKRPAIIDSHRVNYMGTMSLENRQRSLRLLDKLIRNILKKWPEVSFQSSDSLAEKIYY